MSAARKELNFDDPEDFPDTHEDPGDQDDGTLPAPKKRAKRETIYLGLDGEGIGRVPHRYVLLAAGQEPVPGVPPRHWYVEDPKGLSTLQCLRFLTSLPRQLRGCKVSIFAYAFNYDLTKILQDVDDERLYRLFRPELRKRTGELSFQGPAPLHWQGYELNLIGSKFTARAPGDDRLFTVWDVWKFYQGKFVTALKDWKVGSGETQAETERMKLLRSRFADEDLPEIREYCFSETRDMATLAHKLVAAHDEAGLDLTSFYGAGSTASAMLKVMGIKEKLKPTPPPMALAVASAFFGGRFENSVVGEIFEPVRNFDISSAYPYQTCFLPCLLHGEWTHTTRRADIEEVGIRAAVVSYRLQDSAAGKIEHWAPFPFRGEDGSICFPSSSAGGWVWREEYLAGERFCSKEYPGAVVFESAWIYESSCGCQPFEQIPHYYRERCRIGKEGAGIVFKLGPNSVYGKLAQSVGSARYQSWIWAGMITSGCRAQLLDLIRAHTNRADVLMVATDGAFTAGEHHVVPRGEVEAGKAFTITSFDGVSFEPKGTGTAETGKPLGGWECGEIPQGIFAARPGIYFPLNPTLKDIAKVKGRGVGKGTILENHALIVDQFRKTGVDESVVVKDIERFCGAKTSLSYAPGDKTFTRAAGGKGNVGQDMPHYGEWIKRRVEMSFDPEPKRKGVMDDGVHLALKEAPPGVRSMPYKKAMTSPDGAAMALAAAELLEQPDGELEDTEGLFGI